MPAPDFTDQYNTTLSPYEEHRFHAWAYANDKLGDLADYDLRGAWQQSGGAVDARGHGPDTFKKPNHPTFSNESIYDGAEGVSGGRWQQTGKDAWNFLATPGNLKYRSPAELKQYFNEVEPGVQLILPQEGGR